MSDLNTPKASWDGLKDIGSLSILQLLYLLKPAQAWGILVVIFAVLSGTFGLGYKISNLITEVEVVRFKTENAALNDKIRLSGMASEAEVERLKTENAGLREKIKQFLGLTTKERFLSAYLKYMLAKRDHELSPSEQTEETLKEVMTQFRAYIASLLERGEKAREEIDLRGLFLGKGAGVANVKFAYDGSIWPVPPEFGFAAAK